ncbi:MAG: hypothetical protein AB7F59_14705, partial [Bdellovibrionales bacterium]
LALVTQIACTRSQKETNVSSLTVRMPTTQQLSVTSAPQTFQLASTSSTANLTPFTTNTSPFNSLLNPAQLSGFDCFAVLVGGGDYNQKGMCSTSDGQTFGIGAAVGGVPAGQNLSISNIPSGVRSILLVGFNVMAASDCRDFFNQSLPNGRLSYPHVLGKVEQNLQPGDMSLTMTAAYSTTKVNDCHFASSDNTTGGFYGVGYDGDITISASPAELKNITSPTSGRYLTSFSRVNTIVNASTTALPNAAQITIQSSWTSNNLAIGDEIMLYVAAGAGTTACGTQLAPGYSTSGIVKSFSGGTSFLMEMNDSRFLTIGNTQLTAAGTGVTPEFCRLVAVRVPHINNLTVSGGGTKIIKAGTSAGVMDLSITDHTDIGILIMRIAGQLTIDSGTTADFDVSGTGFKGGTATRTRGQGVEGAQDNGSNLGVANGGGYAGTEGAGGGHGGQGGSTNAGITVGDSYGCGPGSTYDASMKCLLGKFFMGGGGGRETGDAGNGGGIIRLFVTAITNNGTLDLFANGSSGSALDDAGGAGGSIFLQTQTVSSSTGSMYFNTIGGDGNSLGGVGGGGRIHIQVLDQVLGLNANNTSQVKGSTGTATGATNGTCYAQGITLNGCP